MSSDSTIIINNMTNENLDDISQYVARFYQNFYTSTHSCPHKFQSFLDNVSINVKKADNQFKTLCDDRITLAEIKDSIRSLKVNHSPGNDGLTSEFYKAYSEELAPFFHSVINE